MFSKTIGVPRAEGPRVNSLIAEMIIWRMMCDSLGELQQLAGICAGRKLDFLRRARDVVHLIAF